MIQFVFGFLLTVTALFMIMLVLVQRGRGGGLAGAFGGMGGQSAFGTKAGDLFTRITIGAAAFWILLCIAALKFIPHDDGDKFRGLDEKSGTRVEQSSTGKDSKDPKATPPGKSADNDKSSDKGSDKTPAKGSDAAPSTGIEPSAAPTDPPPAAPSDKKPE